MGQDPLGFLWVTSPMPGGDVERASARTPGWENKDFLPQHAGQALAENPRKQRGTCSSPSNQTKHLKDHSHLFFPPQGRGEQAEKYVLRQQSSWLQKAINESFQNPFAQTCPEYWPEERRGRLLLRDSLSHVQTSPQLHIWQGSHRHCCRSYWHSFYVGILHLYNPQVSIKTISTCTDGRKNRQHGMLSTDRYWLSFSTCQP